MGASFAILGATFINFEKFFPWLRLFGTLEYAFINEQTEGQTDVKVEIEIQITIRV